MPARKLKARAAVQKKPRGEEPSAALTRHHKACATCACEHEENIRSGDRTVAHVAWPERALEEKQQQKKEKLEAPAKRKTSRHRR